MMRVERLGVRAAAARFTALLVALLANAALADLAPIVALGCCGVVACAVEGGRRALGRAVWVAPPAAAALLGHWALGATSELALVAARIVCGGAWAAWFAATTPWRDFRALVSALGAPLPVLDSIDRSVLHARVLEAEWRARQCAVRARLGRASAPLGALGSLIGNGLAGAIERGERAAECAQLRGKGGAATPCLGGDTLALVGVSLAGRAARPLLEEICFRAGECEWIALVGDSGSGKTTLLRAIAGLDAIASGALHRFGHVLDARSRLADRLDPRVGFLFQNPDDQLLAPTVSDDVAWGLLQRGVSAGAAHARALAELDALALSALAGRSPYSLSFGERRRVALAGLLATDPELLLLDEPTAGIDRRAQARVVERLRELSRARPLTIVWTAHETASLPNEITRVVHLEDGRTWLAERDAPRAIDAA